MKSLIICLLIALCAPVLNARPAAHQPLRVTIWVDNLPPVPSYRLTFFIWLRCPVWR